MTRLFFLKISIHYLCLDYLINVLHIFLVSLHILLDCLNFLFTWSPSQISERFISFDIVEIINLLVWVFFFFVFFLVILYKSHFFFFSFFFNFFIFISFSSLFPHQLKKKKVYFHKSFDPHNLFFLTSSLSFFLFKEVCFLYKKKRWDCENLGYISASCYFLFFFFIVFIIIIIVRCTAIGPLISGPS